jgi:hypothetical protein
MVAFQKQTPQPPKTKAELQEMLAEAVRNTQPAPNRRPPKARKIGVRAPQVDRITAPAFTENPPVQAGETAPPLDKS